MHIRIDVYGNIRRWNDQNQLHSFNGKPAVIRANGGMSWYDNGWATKHVFYDGTVWGTENPSKQEMI